MPFKATPSKGNKASVTASGKNKVAIISSAVAASVVTTLNTTPRCCPNQPQTALPSAPPMNTTPQMDGTPADYELITMAFERRGGDLAALREAAEIAEAVLTLGDAVERLGAWCGISGAPRPCLRRDWSPPTALRRQLFRVPSFAYSQG